MKEMTISIPISSTSGGFPSYLSAKSFPTQHVEPSTTVSPSHIISGNAAKKDL